MANCGVVEFAKGVTIDESKIINSKFIDGEIISSTLKDTHFTGNITFDEDTANQLPVNKEAVAAVFNSCNGLPLIPGTQVPTCEEMALAIRLAVCEGCDGGGGGTVIGGGDTITGTSWDTTNTKLTIHTSLPDGSTKDWVIDFSAFTGGTGSGDTITDFYFSDDFKKILIDVEYPNGSTFTWALDLIYFIAMLKEDNGDTITDVYWDATKTKLTIATELPDESIKNWEVDFSQFVSAGGGDTITGTSWNAAKTILTIHTLLPDGVTTGAWPIDFTGMGMNFEISPYVPEHTDDPEIPTKMYGVDREVLLGKPDVWIRIKIEDATYIVPGYREIHD